MPKKRGVTRKALLTRDLYAEIDQSVADKLFDSVKYPLTVFERSEQFPGCASRLAMADGPVYEYSRKELKAMFKGCVETVSSQSGTSVDSDLFALGGSIIEQAQRALDAAERAGDEYEGPPLAELRAIVNGGIANVVDSRGDWGAYAFCSYLRVRLLARPKLSLSSPRIDLTGVIVEVKATGELWIKFPWLDCSQWCFHWQKVSKCVRAASLTVALELAAEAHADVQATGADVSVRGAFDRLRLNYPILKDIPLEGIANSALGDRLVYVIDASKLIPAIPVLGSKFTVASLYLPPLRNAIGAEITVQKS